MKRKKAIRRSGFTLIEVVVVIVILVTLASIATPLYMNYIKRANVSAAKTQIKMFDDALTNYKMDVGSYPETDAGLQALVENPDDNEKWRGPYLKPASIPKDPWGNDYVYICPGDNDREYDIVSYGADGQPGGEGDNADLANYEDDAKK